MVHVDMVEGGKQQLANNLAALKPFHTTLIDGVSNYFSFLPFLLRSCQRVVSPI